MRYADAHPAGVERQGSGDGLGQRPGPHGRRGRPNRLVVSREEARAVHIPLSGFLKGLAWGDGLEPETGGDRSRNREVLERRGALANSSDAPLSDTAGSGTGQRPRAGAVQSRAQLRLKHSMRLTLIITYTSLF